MDRDGELVQEKRDDELRIMMPEAQQPPLINAPHDDNKFGWADPYGVLIADDKNDRYIAAFHTFPISKSWVSDIAILPDIPLPSPLRHHHDQVVKRGIDMDDGSESLQLRCDARHSPLVRVR